MPLDDVDLLDRLADRRVAGDRRRDIDRPELPSDAARVKPRHVGHQRVRLALRRCRWRGPAMLTLVILAQLLGDVVVAVDQRRALEDAVDPRLHLGIDRLGRRRRCVAATVRSGDGRSNAFSWSSVKEAAVAAAQSRWGLPLAPCTWIDGGDAAAAPTLRKSCASIPTRGSPISTASRPAEAGRRGAAVSIRPPRGAQRASGRDLRQAARPAVARLLLSPTGAMAIEVGPRQSTQAASGKRSRRSETGTSAAAPATDGAEDFRMMRVEPAGQRAERRHDELGRRNRRSSAARPGGL